MTSTRKKFNQKIDFRKELKHLYMPSAKEFSIVDAPPMQYLMVDDKGNPNSAPEYKEALKALYSVSYTLKFASKGELERDYVVPPLEGLWWADNMSAFAKGQKDSWKWTMMTMVPDWINKTMVKNVINSVKEKKGDPRKSVPSKLRTVLRQPVKEYSTR